MREKREREREYMCERAEREYTETLSVDNSPDVAATKRQFCNAFRQPQKRLKRSHSPSSFLSRTLFDGRAKGVSPVGADTFALADLEGERVFKALSCRQRLLPRRTATYALRESLKTSPRQAIATQRDAFQAGAYAGENTSQHDTFSVRQAALIVEHKLLLRPLSVTGEHKGCKEEEKAAKREMKMKTNKTEKRKRKKKEKRM